MKRRINGDDVYHRRLQTETISVETGTDGYMIIDNNIRLYLPVLKIAELDTPNVFYPDVLYSCSKYVPKVLGITTKFVEVFSTFKHNDTLYMLKVFEYTCKNLMYDKYDQDNPGHLYTAMQIFGGWWGGIARETFTRCLREMCINLKDEMDKKYNIVTPNNKVDEIVLGILSAICKCFGCAARTPLLPHIPFGAPPSPISSFVDYIVHLYPTLSKRREELFRKIRDWHVPEYARDEKGAYRTIWESFNQVDRISNMIKQQIII